MDDTKRCPRCGETKSRAAFHRSAKERDGLRTYCKPCSTAKEAERRSDPVVMERVRARYVTYRADPAVVTRDRGRGARWREANRAAVLAHYGGRCACCGETESQFLAVDHIDGGGAEHRRADRSAQIITRWLIRNNFPAGFRLLCHNCNMARGLYGYCPHEREAVEGVAS